MSNFKTLTNIITPFPCSSWEQYFEKRAELCTPTRMGSNGKPIYNATEVAKKVSPPNDEKTSAI